MSAPDFADVSDRIPAIPAQNATKNAKKSGLAMILERLWEAASKFSGLAPIALNSRQATVTSRDRDREADRQREQRPQRERRSALDERDADPGDRAELRADDHRADDEDRRVEQDADGRDEPGEDHERGERPVQLGGLRRPRRHLLPHDGVGRRALRLADRPLHPVGDVEVDLQDGDRAVALHAEVAQVAQDDGRLLAREVDEDEIALRPAGGARQMDEVARGGLVVEQLEDIVGQRARHDDAQVVHGP